jgi:nitrous oxide reductase accessory protein NosL
MKKLNTLLVIAFIAILTSCSKDEAKTEPTPPPVANIPVDIYIAGYEKSVNGNKVAKYWKNGIVTELTDGSSNSDARDITLNNGVVYVCGNEGGVSKYWKNGVATTLGTAGYNYCNSICVSNDDVYVCGYQSYGQAYAKAVYWKNGVAVPLTNGSQRAEALSIEVAGNDVYVVGTIEYSVNNYSGPKATLWKNGNPTPLSTKNSSASDIKVIGTDVYIAGDISKEDDSGNYNSTYWKNGIATSYPDAIYSVYTRSIFVNNNDVYLGSGGIGFGATYYKNGITTNLTQTTSSTITSKINSLFVLNNNVYATGCEFPNDNSCCDWWKPRYWKNGEVTYLTDGTKRAETYSIYVVNK